MPRSKVGRPKGSKGKNTEARRQSVLDEIKMRGKQTPLEFMLKVMWNRKRPLDIRIDAAKAAAPYVHRKMPLEVDHGGEVKVIPPFTPSRKDWTQDS